jgi:hypothetical protein
MYTQKIDSILFGNFLPSAVFAFFSLLFTSGAAHERPTLSVYDYIFFR